MQKLGRFLLQKQPGMIRFVIKKRLFIAHHLLKGPIPPATFPSLTNRFLRFYLFFVFATTVIDFHVAKSYIYFHIHFYRHSCVVLQFVLTKFCADASVVSISYIFYGYNFYDSSTVQNSMLLFCFVVRLRDHSPLNLLLLNFFTFFISAFRQNLFVSFYFQ